MQPLELARFGGQSGDSTLANVGGGRGRSCGSSSGLTFFCYSEIFFFLFMIYVANFYGFVVAKGLVDMAAKYSLDGNVREWVSNELCVQYLCGEYYVVITWCVIKLLAMLAMLFMVCDNSWPN